MFITFNDAAKVVLQFRPEPLDMIPFYFAREALGPIVPEIGDIRNEALEKDGIAIYHMTMMSGRIYCEALTGQKSTALPIINKSLSEIYTDGYLQNSSAAMIEERLRPHFDLIITSELQYVKPY